MAEENPREELRVGQAGLLSAEWQSVAERLCGGSVNRRDTPTVNSGLGVGVAEGRKKLWGPGALKILCSVTVAPKRKANHGRSNEPLGSRSLAPALEARYNLPGYMGLKAAAIDADLPQRARHELTAPVRSAKAKV
jgi:hypothetical protein